MKLLFSDYDGTLCQKGKVSWETIEAIVKFRKAGNAFNLVTGRDLRFLLRELQEYKIPYDYLLCSTGGVIYDQKLQIVREEWFSIQTVRMLLSVPIFREGYYLLISTAKKSYVLGKPAHTKALVERYGVIPLESIEEIYPLSINQISTKFNGAERAHACAEEANRVLGIKAYAHENIDCVDVTPWRVSKLSGIVSLLIEKNWEEKNVTVIGDSYNDLPMIRQFQGYAVKSAIAEVQREASGSFTSVGKLIDTLLTHNRQEETEAVS